MKRCCLLILLFCAGTCLAADVRLTERVGISLPDAPNERLAVSQDAALAFARAHESRDIALPDGVRVHIEWGNPAAYCEKVRALSRVALHTWKTQMEAASQRTFPRNAGWVSSSNVERFSDATTLVVYRFARKGEDGKMQFNTIADVFGQTILGSMTFEWRGAEGDAAESRVSAAIDSIALKE